MKTHVLDLKPTQFALGMREVEQKVEKLKKMSATELDAYQHEHRVPVVQAVGGDLYLIDHHHLVRACWEAHITHVRVELKADLSHLGDQKFWEHMTEQGWVYLHDQFGKGPHAPQLLPIDVRGLADDPFRSLAWLVREHKGFNKSERPFCEFSWANFLRQHLDTHPGRLGFEEALRHALDLCHRPEAKKLPGYMPD
jgi:hypothetical protein